jgi:hypothetical protein
VIAEIVLGLGLGLMETDQRLVHLNSNLSTPYSAILLTCIFVLSLETQIFLLPIVPFF